jgi:hypothetical protein
MDDGRNAGKVEHYALPQAEPFAKLDFNRIDRFRLDEELATWLLATKRRAMQREVQCRPGPNPLGHSSANFDLLHKQPKPAFLQPVFFVNDLLNQTGQSGLLMRCSNFHASSACPRFVDRSLLIRDGARGHRTKIVAWLPRRDNVGSAPV